MSMLSVHLIVGLWSDPLGDIQWREDPIFWNTSGRTTSHVGGGLSNGEASKCSMHTRNVRPTHMHDDVGLHTKIILQPRFPLELPTVVIINY